MKNWKEGLAIAVVAAGIVTVCYILCWGITDFLVNHVWGGG